MKRRFLQKGRHSAGRAPVFVHTSAGLFKQAQTLYFLNTMRVRWRNWNKSITFTPGKKKNIDKQWKRNKIWRHA